MSAAKDVQGACWGCVYPVVVLVAEREWGTIGLGQVCSCLTGTSRRSQYLSYFPQYSILEDLRVGFFKFLAAYLDGLCGASCVFPPHFPESPFLEGNSTHRWILMGKNESSEPNFTSNLGGFAGDFSFPRPLV